MQLSKESQPMFDAVLREFAATMSEKGRRRLGGSGSEAQRARWSDSGRVWRQGLIGCSEKTIRTRSWQNSISDSPMIRRTDVNDVRAAGRRKRWNQIQADLDDAT